jgi:hypothetical protein
MIVPYLHILIIAAIMTIPFYFFNKFLVKRIKPREKGANLLLYFVTVVVSIFIYISAVIFVVIWIAKLIK